MNADQIASQALADYEHYINAAMARTFRFLGIDTLEAEARGAVVTTLHGEQFIDVAGYGVFFHGHSHPRVVKAVQEQAAKLAMSTRLFPHKPVADLGRMLAEVTPGDLQYTFFCNSGAEAVEGAIKIARAHTGKPGIISTHGAFHGKTLGALSATGRAIFQAPFGPLVPGFKHVPYGDAAAVADAIDDETAAVLVEPIQGEGGVIIPPDEYLPRLRQICDARGVLLIADEIQTGVGRTAKMWACEWVGVVPDILCSGKSLGGGVMPISAFTARPAIWDVFEDNPFIHSSTFGGSPIACAAGVAALEAIREEGLLERAAYVGERLLAGLREIGRAHPDVVREVRGRGLLIGVDLATEGVGGMFINEVKNRGVIALFSLNNPKVIRVMPPAILSDAQIDQVLLAFGEAAKASEVVLDQL